MTAEVKEVGGAAPAGEFCRECGGRRAGGRRDLSPRHFAGEAAREFASLEHSKLLRTLGALLFRPGRSRAARKF